MLGAAFHERTPDLEMKTAATKNATVLDSSGRAWSFEHDRRQKIYVLDVGRADRCWAAFLPGYSINDVRMPSMWELIAGRTESPMSLNIVLKRMPNFLLRYCLSRK